MYFVYFKKKERSETILRNSAVRYSIFCGSLFNPGYRSQQSQRQKTLPFWCNFLLVTTFDPFPDRGGGLESNIKDFGDSAGE